VTGIGFNIVVAAATLFARAVCLLPNEGSKTDPAHPAIYPTGEKPKNKLSGVESEDFWQHLEIQL